MRFRTGLWIIIAVTLWRIVMLRFDTTDLFVDEAQYWLWAQHLDFGYYSKPPMIAWVIRAFTWLGHSDSIFWIRLGGPIFHMATAVVLMDIARRFVNADSAGWVGATFITLPGVALSSVLFSTDTILLFFVATALWAYFGLTERRSVQLAIGLGASVGLAFLSKYAILFLLPGGLIAMLLLPSARIAWRDLLIAFVAAALVASPNLLWNAMHDITTVRHTQEIAKWSHSHLNIRGAAEFFLAQFGVVGPVVFFAMLWACLRMIRGKSGDREKQLVWLSMPVVALITFQALIARAYANWAVTAYVAGTILAVLILFTLTRRGLRTSLIINGIATFVFPLLTVFAHDLVLPNGSEVMKRYLGRSEISRDIAAVAREAGTEAIVAEDREILADLFYTLRDQPFHLYARDFGGFPKSYYEQKFPLPADIKDPAVLYVTTDEFTCSVAPVETVRVWQPASGYRKGDTVRAYKVPPLCLASGASPAATQGQ